jgi:hypothetical protein
LGNHGGEGRERIPTLTYSLRFIKIIANIDTSRHIVVHRYIYISHKFYEMEGSNILLRPCTIGVLREGAYENKPSILLSTGAYLYRKGA